VRCSVTPRNQDDASIHGITNDHASAAIGASITSNSSNGHSVVEWKYAPTLSKYGLPVVNKRKVVTIKKAWIRRDRQHLESRLRELAPVPAGPVHLVGLQRHDLLGNRLRKERRGARQSLGGPLTWQTCHALED